MRTTTTRLPWSATIDLEVFDLAAGAAGPRTSGPHVALESDRCADVIHVGGTGRHRSGGPPRLAGAARLVLVILLAVTVDVAVVEHAISRSVQPTAPAATPASAPATTGPVYLDSQWGRRLDTSCDQPT